MKWFSIFRTKNDGVRVCLKQQQKTDAVASKSPRNSLVYFKGITAVNKELYTDILRLLTDTVRRKCPEKMKTISWSLLTTLLQPVSRFWLRIS